MFDEIDADDTGDIDYHEFKELARKWMHILDTGVPETTNFSNKRRQTRRVCATYMINYCQSPNQTQKQLIWKYHRS